MGLFEIAHLVRFVGQASLALAGASAFWGFVFHLMRSRSGDGRAEAFLAFERLMAAPFRFGLGGMLLAWTIGSTFFFPRDASSHEGIRIAADPAFIAEGYRMAGPLLIALVLVTLAGGGARLGKKRFFIDHGGKLYALQFLLVSAIAAVSVWNGGLDAHQGFYSLHNWHSIMTLGTVMVVDLLYLATANHHRLKHALYPFFPIMSMGIWSGLGIDFLSNLLILDEALVPTAQMLFSQTVTAIIIVNGALLSGNINDAMIDSLRNERSAFFSPRFRTVVRLSGALSIASWLTITFVDFFTLPYAYPTLLLGYVGVVIGAFLGERVSEKGLKKALGGLIPA